jgi:hypothetical protein
MLIAQALMVEKFGRGGLKSAVLNLFVISEWMRFDDVSPSDLVNIIRLFEDCETAPLGIHTLISIAKKLEFENPVGRWYSPSQVSHLKMFK